MHAARTGPISEGLLVAVTQLPLEPPDPFTELGVSGSQSVSTHIYDDFLPQLQGRKALATYREMGDNDATIGSILFALSMLMRSVDWTVEPASDALPDQAAAQFLEENLEGLEHPLSDLIAQMTSAVQYGFSFHETVFDRVEDGSVRWLRFANRPQSTLVRWELGDRNEPVAFVQSVDAQTVPIPLMKGIWFRIDSSTVSGRSLIRAAYRSWFFKKRDEEKLQIAIDRNLNGIPIAKIPPEIIAAGAGDSRYDTIRKIVTRTRRDEQAGIMWPLEHDANGNEKYRFDLLSPAHPVDFSQTVAVIRMWAADIANVILAQFVNLGRDSVGSRALAEPQQDIFQQAGDAVLDTMQDCLNRQAVKELFSINPQHRVDTLPKLVHGSMRDVDLKQQGDYLFRLSQAGADLPFDNPKFLRQLMQQGGYNIDEATTAVSGKD